MILILDPSFKIDSSLPSIEFESFIFPGGEPHVKIKSEIAENTNVQVYHRITSFIDLGKLLVAIDALKNMGVQKIDVFLPYFPGARQDRLMVKGEPLTVKVFTTILNQQNLNSITIFDPHSEVTPALLNNCKVIDNHDFIAKVIGDLADDTLLISPDGGALKKIYKVAANLKSYDVVECSKSRDVRTGKLSGFKVYADNLQGKDCLIVDDICDGGGTFLGLAKALKTKNAGRLYLAVSHGIFSKGLSDLLSVFDGIYTTDSFISHPDTENFKQISISSLLNN